MSIENFNSHLAHIKLSERDSSNRPCPFKSRKRNSKYEGSAGQMRVLSRVVTMVLENVLDESEAGKMIVTLQEVAEVITSPKLTEYEIDYTMRELIESYLDQRVEAISAWNMPPARPKHHMLSHYPQCYRNYGPLIGMWSLRMESKHTYFKTVVRSSKNFKNPSKTCAVRHELSQVSHRYYGLFPIDKYEVPGNSSILTDYLQEDSDNILVHKALEKFDGHSLVLERIKVHGTLYSIGSIVVLDKECHGELVVGVVKMMIFSNNRLVLYCSSFEVMQNRHNIYMTQRLLNENVWIPIEKLKDYHPLTAIGLPKLSNWF